MRRPEGTCPNCWQPHDFLSGEPCYPFTADERTYGDPNDGPSWTTDRFESFVLDATHPRQDTRRGCPGFQVEQAKAVVAAIRVALAEETLTLDDIAHPSDLSGDEHR